MDDPYTAVVKQEGKFWIGWVNEVASVNAQERTKKKLLASLPTILREALKFDSDGRGVASFEIVKISGG